jgi:DNA polymerase-4
MIGPAVGFAEVADFHVAVARKAQPSLAQRGVLVGGHPQKRGKVVAASADLRSQGIAAGMLLSEALDRAPDATWVQTDMQRARELSGLLRAAVRQESEAVEVDGLAGFYMEAPWLREQALGLAERLETRVREATGMALRVGVAPARFAARLAAQDAGLTGAACIIAESEFDAYLLRQPIERLPGVGPKTAARLAELGASDVPSLRALGLECLEVVLGNHGRTLWMLACGEDPRPLRVKRHPTTLSREQSLAVSSRDRLQIGTSLEQLAGRLEAALRREGLRAGRIALRLTFEDSRTLTRSQTLPAMVSAARPLALAAHDLLLRVVPSTRPIRKIGLMLGGLETRGAEDRQLDLF